MKKIDLGQTIAILANVGVIAGIVFLAIEVRQNTESIDQSRRVAMAEAYQSRANATMEIMFQLAGSQHSEIEAQLVEYGWPGDSGALAMLSPSERISYTNMEIARWTHFDNLHYQYQQGYVDEEFYRYNFEGLVRRFAPTWKALGLGTAGRPTFRAEVERILSAAAD